MDLITFCPNQWMKWLKEPEFKNNTHLFISSSFKKRLQSKFVSNLGQQTRSPRSLYYPCSLCVLDTVGSPLFHSSSVPIHIPEY